MNDPSPAPVPRRRRLRPFSPMTRGARHAAAALAIIMLAITGGSYLLASTAIHQGLTNAASVQQLCQASNESRAEQVQLWTYLLSLTQPPPGETPAARTQRLKTIQAFTAYLHTVFAPRPCQEPPQ